LFIDAVYGEYNQFGPAIADELRRDDDTRELVLDTVVRPLLAWYELAGALALADAGVDTLLESLRRQVQRCVDMLAGGGLETAVLGITDGEVSEAGPTAVPSGLALLAPRFVDYPLASWALLDPLMRLWRAAHRIDEVDLIAEIGEWLAAAPFKVAAGRESLPDEVRSVTGFLGDHPELSRQLQDKADLAKDRPSRTSLIANRP